VKKIVREFLETRDFQPLYLFFRFMLYIAFFQMTDFGDDLKLIIINPEDRTIQRTLAPMIILVPDPTIQEIYDPIPSIHLIVYPHLVSLPYPMAYQ
jgi:hypothetical protein